MSSPQLLFISGIGRSGTTALADLMSSHPQIIMGMERFKFAYLRGDGRGVTAEFFDRERFFDFSDQLTNITPSDNVRWAQYYDRMAARWDDALYVGDKFTHSRLLRLWEAMPEARVVHIIRDIDAVAASWQARADNPLDRNWPAQMGARQAVAAWNTGLRRARRASRLHPDLIAIVEYQRMFSDPDAASLRAVLDWLDLEPAPEMLSVFQRLHSTYLSSVAPKERRLSAADAAFVDEHADRRLWRRMVRRRAM